MPRRHWDESDWTRWHCDTAHSSSFEPYEEPHMLRYPHPPGFIPLQLGDRLCNGRYDIVRKLGYGISSSVWLARDR